MSGSIQPGRTSVSLLRNTTTGAEAAAAPWLHPAAKPVLTELRSTSARSSQSRRRVVMRDSVEALLTRISSRSSRPSASSEARHFASRPAIS